MELRVGILGVGSAQRLPFDLQRLFVILPCLIEIPVVETRIGGFTNLKVYE